MDMLAVHQKYGPIVRVAPNKLAISHESAWRDVMTGSQELPKWTEYYKVQDPQPTYIMSAPDDEHTATRRKLGQGFSDRAMREMEHTIQGYIKQFLDRIQRHCDNVRTEEDIGEEVVVLDLHKWFNFLTFDLVGDLALGEPYDCLKYEEYHPWVAPIFEVTQISAIMSSMSHYPWLKKTLLRVFRTVIETKLREHQAHTRIKLEARMALQRSDLVDGLLKAMEKDVSSKVCNLGTAEKIGVLLVLTQ